jgi:hypothetical protein
MEIVGNVNLWDWLSTSPNSVDSLPSLHLNLISRGRPVFERNDHKDPAGIYVGIILVRGGGAMLYPCCIMRMMDILQRHLYDTLLPVVWEISNLHIVKISDVFLCNYRKKED